MLLLALVGQHPKNSNTHTCLPKQGEGEKQTRRN